MNHEKRIPETLEQNLGPLTWAQTQAKGSLTQPEHMAMTDSVIQVDSCIFCGSHSSKPWTSYLKTLDSNPMQARGGQPHGRQQQLD